ncbi:hypothetical protein AN1V17_16710 [Vallitalea sediminicola]
MKSNKVQLKNRGYIDDNELKQYNYLTKLQLIKLLQSDIATDRTIAARLLVRYKEFGVIEVLICSLINETKLYTKIALSECIGTYGEKASEMLIEHLGKVGNNQHRSLPSRPFEKKNYPLPRDIIARTMCKIGKPALNQLRCCLYSGEYIQILEAIDAIGFISYYEKDTTSLEDIIQLFTKYKDDTLVIWKLLRSLQSFKDERVQKLLKIHTASSIEQHRWEAKRSLEQINRQITL